MDGPPVDKEETPVQRGGTFLQTLAGKGQR